jgi:hypothetical protein
MKNPKAPAVKREAEEDWGNKRRGRCDKTELRCNWCGADLNLAESTSDFNARGALDHNVKVGGASPTFRMILTRL